MTYSGALEALEEKGVEAMTILTNIKDHLQLWHYRNLTSSGKLAVTKCLSGYAHDVEIMYFRGLPEGISAIVNSQKARGTLSEEDHRRNC